MSIQRLRELLIGTFDNKRQAYQNPTFYAHIRLIHKDIGDNLIYGEQAYTYEQGRPYRQFVIEPVMDGELMKVKNYDIKEKNRFTGFKNLDNITPDDLYHNTGCDLLFNQVDYNTFTGGLYGCDCMVRDSYVQSRVQVTTTTYTTIDIGYSKTTNEKVWGSDYGPFEFDRVNA